MKSNKANCNVKRFYVFTAACFSRWVNSAQSTFGYDTNPLMDKLPNTVAAIIIYNMINYQGLNDHIGGSKSPRVGSISSCICWVWLSVVWNDLTHPRLSFAHFVVRILKIWGKNRLETNKVSLWATNNTKKTHFLISEIILLLLDVLYV